VNISEASSTTPVMSESIEYALCALVLYGLADFVYKRGAAAGAEPHQFMMVQTWFFTPCALVYGLTSGTLKFNAAALWGAPAGVLAIAGYYNFAHSLKSGSVSTNATIFRLSFAVTAALAILVLGEPVTAPKLAGLALVVLAVWLLLGAAAPGSHVTRHETKSSLTRVLVATVIVGLLSFIYKLGMVSGASPVGLVVTQGFFALPVATGLSAYLDRGIRPSRAAWKHPPVAAGLLAAAFIFLAKGLRNGQASLVVPVAQMGFVVSALLGFVVLREPVTLRKAAGLAVAAAALIYLSRG
jgi:drug/metabolite transporter (DMT)-like permease